MRRSGGVALVLFALSACGERASPSVKAPVPNLAIDFIYGEFDQAKLDKVLKRFPERAYYDNKASCEAAGERWGPAYWAGMLLQPDPPAPGSEVFEYRCWVEATPLADGDKICAGPSDCIGNCVGALIGDEDFLAARCQRTQDEPNCTAIYDGVQWIISQCIVV